jgi:hypothetical protein
MTTERLAAQMLRRSTVDPDLAATLPLPGKKSQLFDSQQFYATERISLVSLPDETSGVRRMTTGLLRLHTRTRKLRWIVGGIVAVLAIVALVGVRVDDSVSVRAPLAAAAPLVVGAAATLTAADEPKPSAAATPVPSASATAPARPATSPSPRGATPKSPRRRSPRRAPVAPKPTTSPPPEPAPLPSTRESEGL